MGSQTVSDYAGAVIELVLSQHKAASGETMLRYQLLSMKQGALTRTATAIGVTDAQLERAEGKEEGYSAAVIELIVEKVILEDRATSEATLREELTEMKQVRKRRFFAPFCTKNDHFAKTGSGQT
jgi:hypothetical protein